MKLSKTSAHAALAMAYLATRTDGSLLQARTVAEYLGVPTDSALKILQGLARRGLIHSQLGRTGGYRLQRPAAQVSLLEIVEAIDGPIGAMLPISEAEPHLHGGLDLIQSVCEQAARLIRQELARTTVADLAACDGRHVLAPTG